MLGIYKTSDGIFLLEYTSYGKIDWKKIFGKKDRLAPQIFFERKGLLLLYNLKDCRIEKERILYKGKAVQLHLITK